MKRAHLYQKIEINLSPELIAAKLVRRELCSCGMNVVKLDIPLGEEYAVDLKSIRWARMLCKGCGKTFEVRLIDTWNYYPDRPEWFFLDVLDLGEGIPESPKPLAWQAVRDGLVAPPIRFPGISGG